MAIRFEAQELLAALAELRARMSRFVSRPRSDAPWRDATQLVESLKANRA
jgi:hypothetical protein